MSQQAPEKLERLEALIKRLTNLDEIHSVGQQIAQTFGYQAGCLATYRANQDEPYATYCYGESADVLEQNVSVLHEKLLQLSLGQEHYLVAEEPLELAPSVVIYNATALPKYTIAYRVGVLAFINWQEVFTAPVKPDLYLSSISSEFVSRVISLELEQEKEEIQQVSTEIHNYEGIIYRSKAMQKVVDNIKKYASSDSMVLISGDSGVGKELVARAIHTQSTRNGKPFISINCAAIPKDLMESELFGHEKGAFTGATQQKKGLFELASDGTLLLDEVGEMELGVQAKLLRVLEERKFMRVGGTKEIAMKARLIAATNKNLEKAVKAGMFREDLRFRLEVLPISVPPLRERKEDIPILAKYFLQELTGKSDEQIDLILLGLIPILEEYSWPGNVRQMRNLIERMVVQHGYEPKKVQSMLQEKSSNPILLPLTLKESVERVKQALLEFAEALTKNIYLSSTSEHGLITEEDKEEADSDLNPRQQEALKCMKEGIRFTSKTYADKYEISTKTALKDLNELIKKSKLVEKKGNARSTKYCVKLNDSTIPD